MPISDDFAQGALSATLNIEPITDPNALHGVWIEKDKPVDELVEVLKRLGLSAVKRRIVARCHSKVEIFVSYDDEVKTEAPEEPPTEDTEATPPRSGSTTAATTPTQSPGSLKIDSSSTAKIKWAQRQYFPMGRTRESEFVSDGETVHAQEDPETDVWNTRVIWTDGCLIQRRESQKLGITMYDTRCAFRRSDNELLQLFQWTLIDHQNGDRVTQVHYYLTKDEAEAATS